MMTSQIRYFAQGRAAIGADETVESAIITAKGVSKTWGGAARGERGLVALTPLDLSIKSGEFVVLLGPSGCGKSTLLRLIAGLEQPTTGEIQVGGRIVKGPGWERGLIFQDYALFPWRSVLRNITFGLEARGIPDAQRNERALDLIRLVGLEGFAHAYPSQLSGGMQQRVALARALANDPMVLLMDEPFSAVDSQTRETLQDEILKIWQVTGKTIVFVTHDIAEAAYLADRVITMAPRPGRIKNNISIELPRPRDRSSPNFMNVSRRLRQELAPPQHQHG